MLLVQNLRSLASPKILIALGNSAPRSPAAKLAYCLCLDIEIHSDATSSEREGSSSKIEKPISAVSMTLEMPYPPLSNSGYILRNGNPLLTVVSIITRITCFNSMGHESKGMLIGASLDLRFGL